MNTHTKVKKDRVRTTTSSFGVSSRSERGFTLIELLVVIAIIGLISGIVLASLSTARQRGRDAQRLSDMRQIETALQLFFDDNQHFPGGPESVSGRGEKIGVGEDIDTALAPYLSRIPVDPLHDGAVYYYSYDPQHNVPGSSGGVVFGFNKAEATSDIRRDTTSGGHQNLNNADYNVALFPKAP